MLSSTGILLVTFVVISLLSFLKSVRNYTRSYLLMRRIPGPPVDGVIIGNMTFFHTSADEIFNRQRQAAKTYYPLYRLQGVNKFGVNILTPEHAALILSNPVHNRKGYIYNLFHKWLQFGLLTSSGSKWQTRRKILTPAFHFSILQQFVVVFNEAADELVEVLAKESHKSYVNVTPLVAQFTLKSITETAMGTKLQFNTKKNQDYKEAVDAFGKIFVYKLTHPWCIDTFGNIFSPWFIKEIRLTNSLHKFTREIIEEREESFELSTVNKGKRFLAMLDLLISIKKKEGTIDNTGIQEEVDTFMFEGHDTTSAALSFILMLLACHKDVQKNIVQEMREVLEDVHKKPTYNDFQNMKYLERCIKESLRLYPSVHLIIRTLGEDINLDDWQILPKGIEAVVHIYDIHHNSDIYPEPEKFDPERFLPENSQNRHPFAYLPFSAGPRNCIGQRFAMLELKAAVCAILASFVLEPIDTPETTVLMADIVLRAKEGIKIRFTSRC